MPQSMLLQTIDHSHTVRSDVARLFVIPREARISTLNSISSPSSHPAQRCRAFSTTLTSSHVTTL